MGTTLKSRLGKILLPKLPITRENFEILRHELRMLRVNANNFLNPWAILRVKKGITGTDISVNLGAGPFGKPGWTNIDIRSFDNISFTYDCRKKLPFRDATVARIRCEHVFEHLDKRDEVPAFLSECLRAMKPGGTLRIVVPDLEKFIRAYVSKDPKEWALLGWNIEKLPANFHTPMDILNHTFRQDGEHKYGYDIQTLSQTLTIAGFQHVLHQSWGVSKDHLLTDDLENHKNYSIYVDAIK